MTNPQYVSIDAVKEATGKARPTLADAISLAESRLYHSLGDDIAIEDVEAKRLRNSQGWAVTFTTVKVEDDPIHSVVIRGGRNMYCVECDKDVASLVAIGKPNMHWNIDAAHQREVMVYVAPAARGNVRLIY